MSLHIDMKNDMQLRMYILYGYRPVGGKIWFVTSATTELDLHLHKPEHQTAGLGAMCIKYHSFLSQSILHIQGTWKLHITILYVFEYTATQKRVLCLRNSGPLKVLNNFRFIPNDSDQPPWSFMNYMVLFKTFRGPLSLKQKLLENSFLALHYSWYS